MNNEPSPNFLALLKEELSKYYSFDEIFPAGLPIDHFKTISFADAKGFADIEGTFDSDCKLIIDPALLEQEPSKREISLHIRQFGKNKVIKNAVVILSRCSGSLTINFANDDAIIIFGEGCQGHYDLRVFRNAFFCAGDNTTSNGARIILDKSLVVLGSDCLLSDEILIQSSDQHGIIDLTTGEIINDTYHLVIVERHAWIGRRATLMPDIRIGEGSIIGACSVVTRDVPATTIAAGVPAKALKSNHTWSRHPEEPDARTARFLVKLLNK